jgi:hypothetical protein
MLHIAQENYRNELVTKGQGPSRGRKVRMTTKWQKKILEEINSFLYFNYFSVNILVVILWEKKPYSFTRCYH